MRPQRRPRSCGLRPQLLFEILEAILATGGGEYAGSFASKQHGSVTANAAGCSNYEYNLVLQRNGHPPMIPETDRADVINGSSNTRDS